LERLLSTVNDFIFGISGFCCAEAAIGAIKREIKKQVCFRVDFKVFMGCY
jgi:hypothetical protein